MTTHYRVLRPVEQADLDIGPRLAEVLRMIPPDGHITFGHFKGISKDRASKAVKRACSMGILKRASPYEHVENLESVKFWLTQLNDSGHKHTKSSNGTKELYMRALSKFDEWLSGKPFRLHKTVWYDGEETSKPVTKSFGNVEELLDCCRKPSYGSKAAQRVMREYMATPQVAGGVGRSQPSHAVRHKVVFWGPRRRAGHAENEKKAPGAGAG